MEINYEQVVKEFGDKILKQQYDEDAFYGVDEIKEIVNDMCTDLLVERKFHEYNLLKLNKKFYNDVASYVHLNDLINAAKYGVIFEEELTEEQKQLLKSKGLL